MSSKQVLLYVGEEEDWTVDGYDEEDSDCDKNEYDEKLKEIKTYAVIMPEFNSPVFPQVHSTYVNELLYEFFYHFNENYIIYVFHGYNFQNEILIQAAFQNGDIIDEYRVKMNTEKDSYQNYSNIPVLVSPNGRFIAYPENPNLRKTNVLEGTDEEKEEKRKEITFYVYEIFIDLENKKLELKPF